LVFMVISMAIGTSVKLQRIRQFCFMTLLAFNLLMFSLQLEVCFVVIKVLNPFYCAEWLSRMALGTILSEFIVMYICVAWGTVIKF
jgi:hypothetical protein